MTISTVKSTLVFGNKLGQNIRKYFRSLHGRDLMNNSLQIAHPHEQPAVIFKEQEDEFTSYFPTVVKSLADKKFSTEMPNVAQKLVDILEYNVPIGEKVKGVTTVASYKMLEKSENLTDENIKLVNILGWCTELLEATNAMADDFINNSVARRNAPCWFRLPNNGYNACLDLLVLEISIFKLLKTYFSDHPFYTPMTDFFHTVLYRTSVGRVLDYEKRRVDQLNMEMFHKVTEYKIGYDAFYVGVTLAMYFSRTYDCGLHRQVAPLLMDMGRYFQIKNDVQGCFDDTTHLNTNVEKGKCDWLVATALQKSSHLQKQTIEDNYGRMEIEAIKNIRNLYKTLDIDAEFRAYSDRSYKTLCINIEKLTDSPMKNLLHSIMHRLYAPVYYDSKI